MTVACSCARAHLDSHPCAVLPRRDGTHPCVKSLCFVLISIEILLAAGNAACPLALSATWRLPVCYTQAVQQHLLALTLIIGTCCVLTDQRWVELHEPEEL